MYGLMMTFSPAKSTDDVLTRRALRHALDGTTDMADRELKVPLHYYRDPKITEIEESQILRQVPLAIVPSAQIPEPNDYVVRTVLGDSLLVTRDRTGASHVLLNYCRHRGAMPACGSGNAARFVCPYHAWTYKNTGELFMVPGKSGFDSMDIKDYGLVELPSEERYGFIWAVLSADATIDIDAHLGPLKDELAQWDYPSYGYHTEREFSSEVSWKGALEAFAEGYHFPFVHGESLIGQNTLPNTAVYDEFGKHHRIGFPFTWIKNLATGASGTAVGDPSGAFDPSANMGVIYWVYPNLILANSPVGVEIIDMLPDGDPTRCTVRHSWMGRVPATDDDMRALYDTVFEGVHAAVRDEDFAMLPQCGQGVRHGQHDHMIIGRNEIAVQHMIKVFAAELGIALD
jgi:phenylpropionate dioxygenase-like ring-hydroxylating dioxygenase large terminal subunit